MESESLYKIVKQPPAGPFSSDYVGDYEEIVICNRSLENVVMIDEYGIKTVIEQQQNTYGFIGGILIRFRKGNESRRPDMNNSGLLNCWEIQIPLQTIREKQFIYVKEVNKVFTLEAYSSTVKHPAMAYSYEEMSQLMRDKIINRPPGERTYIEAYANLCGVDDARYKELKLAILGHILNIECTSFPGPGNQARIILRNPTGTAECSFINIQLDECTTDITKVISDEQHEIAVSFDTLALQNYLFEKAAKNSSAVSKEKYDEMVNKYETDISTLKLQHIKNLKEHVAIANQDNEILIKKVKAENKSLQGKISDCESELSKYKAYSSELEGRISAYALLQKVHSDRESQAVKDRKERIDAYKTYATAGAAIITAAISIATSIIKLKRR